MQRLQAINPKTANGKAKTLLDGVQAKLGVTPNLMRTLANSPAVLEAYLSFGGALAKGELTANACGYCLAAHTAIGKSVGLSNEAVLDARRSEAGEPKDAAALRFVRKVVRERGQVTDADVTELRRAGYGDGEIAEIVANVALNVFTNYFNHVAGTEVDFPAVPEPSVGASCGCD